MKTQIKRKAQKGFSLVELMVVIAIIAILAAVAIPMYSNYTTRAKLGTALAAAGSVKAEVAETAANKGGLSGITTAVADAITVLPSETKADLAYTTDVAAAGVITITFTAPKAGTLVLTPTEGTGSITWVCTSTTFTSSEAPNGCS